MCWNSEPRVCPLFTPMTVLGCNPAFSRSLWPEDDGSSSPQQGGFNESVITWVYSSFMGTHTQAETEQSFSEEMDPFISACSQKQKNVSVRMLRFCALTLCSELETSLYSLSGVFCHYLHWCQVKRLHKELISSLACQKLIRAVLCLHIEIQYILLFVLKSTQLKVKNTTQLKTYAEKDTVEVNSFTIRVTLFTVCMDDWHPLLFSIQRSNKSRARMSSLIWGPHVTLHGWHLIYKCHLYPNLFHVGWGTHSCSSTWHL